MQRNSAQNRLRTLILLRFFGTFKQKTIITIDGIPYPRECREVYPPGMRHMMQYHLSGRHAPIDSIGNQCQYRKFRRLT